MEPQGPPPKLPWYFATGFVVFAFLSVGPLALPLLWFHPKISPAWKLFWTVTVLALSWAAVTFSMAVFKKVLDQYRELGLIS